VREDKIVTLNIDIYMNDNWNNTMSKMLMVIIIKYFKKYPSAFIHFWNIYQEKYPSLFLEKGKKQIEKKETEQRKKVREEIKEALARQARQEQQRQELEIYKRERYQELLDKEPQEVTEDEKRFIEDYEYEHPSE
jgi:hypothetical protein